MRLTAASEQRMHLLSFYLFLSLWVHPSPLSPPSIANRSPLPSFLIHTPSFSLLFFGFPDQYVLFFLLQAWLTEIHEYAQQDVVVMLLGNKVRPCCQHWEMDGQMDSQREGSWREVWGECTDWIYECAWKQGKRFSLYTYHRVDFQMSQNVLGGFTSPIHRLATMLICENNLTLKLNQSIFDISC